MSTDLSPTPFSFPDVALDVAMEISKPNDCGVLERGRQQIVARHGARSYAAVNFALSEDGLYRFSIELHYSYGGFGGPIRADDDGYATALAAEQAGTEELLRAWVKPFASDPRAVHEELRAMREQIESRLRQPSLF